MSKVTVLNICNLIKVLILNFDNNNVKFDKIDVKNDKNDVILLKMTHFTENGSFKNVFIDMRLDPNICIWNMFSGSKFSILSCNGSRDLEKSHYRFPYQSSY